MNCERNFKYDGVQCDQFWRHFAFLMKSLVIFGGLFSIGQILNVLWKFSNAIGQILIGQILKLSQRKISSWILLHYFT